MKLMMSMVSVGTRVTCMLYLLDDVPISQNMSTLNLSVLAAVSNSGLIPNVDLFILSLFI